MKNKRYFPLYVDLSDKNIVVVGGGTIATRRVKALLLFTRNITVIAPKMTADLWELGKLGKIQIQPRPVKKSDFSMAYMVLAVTNNSELNEEIYRICKEEGIYVNVASDKNLCDFYFPGICLKDDIVVGITASGVNHKKAKAVREKMQALLEELENDEDSYEEKSCDRKQGKQACRTAKPDGEGLYCMQASANGCGNPDHEDYRRQNTGPYSG